MNHIHKLKYPAFLHLLVTEWLKDGSDIWDEYFQVCKKTTFEYIMCVTFDHYISMINNNYHACISYIHIIHTYHDIHSISCILVN